MLNTTLKVILLFVSALHISYSLSEVFTKDMNDISNQLQSLLSDLQEKEDVIGLGAIVMQDGAVKAQAVAGYRMLSSNKHVTVNDQWHIGSITKSITATMIMSLVNEGKLTLDSPITDFFNRHDINQSWNKVTLHHLLTHTSGVKPNFSVLYQFKNHAPEGKKRSDARLQAVLSILKKSTQNGDFKYSNVGYTIAGVIAEQVTGKSWETLVRERIFTPLKLHSGGFGNPHFDGEKLTQPRGHSKSIFGKRTPVDQLDDNTPIMGPAGTVHMSLQDLARYGYEHLLGSKGHGQLLDKTSYQKLHTAEKSEYAYGWVVSEQREWADGKIIWHNGSNTMWYALIVIMPEKNAVMAFTANEGRVRMLEENAFEIFRKIATKL